MELMEAFYLVGLCAVILLFILAVFDINRRVYQGKKRTIYWVWLMFFFPIVGPLLYFQLRDRI
jgi:hypothetical protein